MIIDYRKSFEKSMDKMNYGRAYRLALWGKVDENNKVLSMIAWPLLWWQVWLYMWGIHNGRD